MSTGTLPGGPAPIIVNQSGLIPLGVYTASGAASIPIVTRNLAGVSGAIFQSDFDEYEFVVQSVVGNTAGMFLRAQVSSDGGATYDTTANYDSSILYWRGAGSGLGGGLAQTAILLSAPPPGGMNTAVAGGGSAKFSIFNPSSTTIHKQFQGKFIDYENTANAYIAYDFEGAYLGLSAINAIKFIPSAGTFTIVVLVYGKAKSTSASSVVVSQVGRVVQVQNFQTGAYTTGSTAIPLDNTIPQITEGDQYMSLTITPTNAANKLQIDIVCFSTSNAASWTTAALFQDSTVNAIAALSNYQNISGGGMPIVFRHTMIAGTTSSTTFKLRIGPDVSRTIFFNGINTGVVALGGVMASSITITEISV